VQCGLPQDGLKAWRSPEPGTVSGLGGQPAEHTTECSTQVEYKSVCTFLFVLNKYKSVHNCVIFEIASIL
jgi:hypothetical protein